MLKPILLVEDNPKDVELSLVALAKSQLANEVVVVRDGADALDYLRCAGDYRESGAGQPRGGSARPEIAKGRRPASVRTDQERSRISRAIPVVVLTSSREEKDLLRKLSKPGVNAYVVKPVSFKEFIEAIQESRDLLGR